MGGFSGVLLKDPKVTVLIDIPEIHRVAVHPSNPSSQILHFSLSLHCCIHSRSCPTGMSTLVNDPINEFKQI